MKRFAAILFLSVLLFNLLGYQVVIACLQNTHETKLVVQIDNEDYDVKELISVKTPLTLPYYSNAATYERVNGTMVIEGIEYKYVKRRIYNDSLELLCLPNKMKRKFQSASVDFFKSNTDLQTTGQGKKSVASYKNVLPEYCAAPFDYCIENASDITHHFFLRDTNPVTSISATVQEQPPDSMLYIG